jgi:non-specific serine/threonine protein kinase/serine/threonine-protein kinase
VRSQSDANFWADVDAVFSAAVDLLPEARPALLEASCNGRPDLRSEVESLLAAHDQATGFLQPGGARPSSPLAPGCPPGPFSHAVEALGPGTLVGAYRLVEKIGEGGMGSVFRAERADRAFAHDVAVKVTRGSLAGADAARRFRAERQILATLHHPHIVTLIDGGTLPGGEAYLVMELVDGVPITRGCRERPASLEERLRLFRQVCSAVHYAHRHAIVHRDLKPANILLTPDGLPKVLDFGVAKLLAASPDNDGHTLTGAFPGPLTPNYASPEQLRGLPVTTACDVYALGVLLYELITGQRPYETSGQPFDRLLELVVHTMPARPSATGGAADDPLPYERRRLRGDLDAIVLKALAKEPERRYASAEELADDVGRFLGGKPVVAREPSAGYVLRKLAARHKGVVAVGALALVGVLASLGVALWQQRIAERERAQAQRRFTEVRQLANALIFKVHDTIVHLAGATAVRKTIAEEAVKYLEQLAADGGDDPGLRLELARGFLRVADILGDPNGPNLGDYEGGLRYAQRAAALVRPLADAPDATPKVLEESVNMLRRLSDALMAVRRPDEAREAAQQSVRYAERYHARNRTDALARRQLASALYTAAQRAATPRDAQPLWQRCAELFRTLLAEQPADRDRIRNVALVERNLALAFFNADDVDAAERHYQQSIALHERRLAVNPRDPQARMDLAIDLSFVASVAERRKDHTAAVALLTRSIDIRRTLFDSDSADMRKRELLAAALLRLAHVERARGDLASAAARMQEAITLREAVPLTAATAAQLAFAVHALASVQQQAGQRTSACRTLLTARELFRRIPNPYGDALRERNEVEQAVAKCASRG